MRIAFNDEKKNVRAKSKEGHAKYYRLRIGSSNHLFKKANILEASTPAIPLCGVMNCEHIEIIKDRLLPKKTENHCATNVVPMRLIDNA